MEISKRDYFAAQALIGLLARTNSGGQNLKVHETVAQEAFLYADEMLKLSKTLMDPIEFDPDKMAAEVEAPIKEKQDKPPKLNDGLASP